MTKRSSLNPNFQDPNDPLLKAEEFLKEASQFRLGDLSTEKVHPLTNQLAEHAQDNLSLALEVLKEIDLSLFEKIESNFDQLITLKNEIKNVLGKGKRVFLCGCGATGRLSLALENLWRQKGKKEFFSQFKTNQVIGFMAGGDVALVRSIEKFEDYPDFGGRQLEELGFSKGDLLISCTEGGETPFVIGATNRAFELGDLAPYFLYCNPDDVLSRVALRSREVIENPRIKKVNLDVGPMALSGSTRMQASTILMLFVGLALLYSDQEDEVLKKELKKIKYLIKRTNFQFLIPFIEEEHKIYEDQGYIYYKTHQELGVSILTDTTERSPTFSLAPFENTYDQNLTPSLSYLHFSNIKNGKLAWEKLLLRSPRTFYWKEVSDLTTTQQLYGFDFGQSRVNWKKEVRFNHYYHNFNIFQSGDYLQFQLNKQYFETPLFRNSPLGINILLKVLLNNHSTLVMGRLGRYENNLMTWVRPSNKKLIDRAIRYSERLLKKRGVGVSYDQLAKRCFLLMEQLKHNQSIVLELVRYFSYRPKTMVEPRP